VGNEEILSFTTEWLSVQLGQPVLPEANFGALGMDSLDAVALTDALADKLGLDELPVSMVLDYPSALALSEQLSALSGGSPSA
jgi:acyl carrier protein